MQYNVAQLLQDDVGATRHYELNEPPRRLDEGVELSEPLVGPVKLMRMNRSILADVDATTALRLECSRCLAELNTPVEVRFAEEYFPTVDLRTGLPVAAPPGATGFMLSESHELDLTEAMRQYLLMALPMKPLCRAECAGLCPHCGKDLNQGPCSCRTDAEDPRLGRLAEWLRANQ